MRSRSKFIDLNTLVSHVKDGDMVAIPSAFNGDFSGVPMSATRALIRRGIRCLHLLCVPGSSLQADLLVGAGCVAVVESGSVLLYEHGRAQRFIDAQRLGSIEVKESTCPAIHAALIAGEKGLPFMPVRGVIGSDILRHREADGDWQIIENPFGSDDPIVVVGGIRPQVALFHVPFADQNGNVWIGRRSELSTMARAAETTLVTFEKLFDGDLLTDDDKSPATIPAMYIEALCHQPKGAWPLHMGAEYGEDTDHMRTYTELAKTQKGFAEYLQQYVHREGEVAGEPVG